MADPPPPPGIPKVVLAVAGFFGFALPLVGVRAVTAEAAMERREEEAKRRLADQRVARLLQPNLSQVTASAALRSKEEVDAATGHLTDLHDEVKGRKTELETESKTLDTEVAPARAFVDRLKTKTPDAPAVDPGQPDKIDLVFDFNQRANGLNERWEELKGAISIPVTNTVGEKAVKDFSLLQKDVGKLEPLSTKVLSEINNNIQNWRELQLTKLKSLPSAP